LVYCPKKLFRDQYIKNKKIVTILYSYLNRIIQRILTKVVYLPIQVHHDMFQIAIDYLIMTIQFHNIQDKLMNLVL